MSDLPIRLTKEDLAKIQWAIDRVRELVRQLPPGVNVQKLADDFDALKRWKEKIRVEGATYFHNNAIDMQIVLPKPRPPINQLPQNETVVVKLTGTVAGGGCYTSSVYGGGLTVSGSSNVTLPASLANAGGALTLNIAEQGTSGHTLEADTFHVGKLLGGNASGPIVAIDAGGKVGSLFRVNLTQTGGATGTKTTAATWTYTVTDLNSVQLATGASPEKPRENGTKTAATKGYGYYDADGTFVLAEAWEAPGTAAC